VARRTADAGRRPIALEAFADSFLRVAGAIVLDALAFVVWNVGTRPPLNLLRDVRAGFRDGRTALAGLASAVVGFVFVMAATVLLMPAIVDKARDLAPALIFTFVVALAVEHLVGDDLRRYAGVGRTSPR